MWMRRPVWMRIALWMRIPVWAHQRPRHPHECSHPACLRQLAIDTNIGNVLDQHLRLLLWFTSGTAKAIPGLNIKN